MGVVLSVLYSIAVERGDRTERRGCYSPQDTPIISFLGAMANIKRSGVVVVARINKLSLNKDEHLQIPSVFGSAQCGSGGSASPFSETRAKLSLNSPDPTHRVNLVFLWIIAHIKLLYFVLYATVNRTCGGSDMAKRGRPSKFDQQTQDILIVCLLHGLTHSDAARQAGIHPKTFLRWLRKGQAAKSGQYYDFCLRVHKAELEARAVWLDRVNNGWTETCIKRVNKDGEVISETIEMKHKQIDPLRWLCARYPHKYGKHAVRELAGDEVIDRFFDVIEERYGKDAADKHRDLYDLSLAGAAVKAEDNGAVRNPFRKPIIGV